jgi:hypothetical protein
MRRLSPPRDYKYILSFGYKYILLQILSCLNSVEGTRYLNLGKTWVKHLRFCLLFRGFSSTNPLKSLGLPPDPSDCGSGCRGFNPISRPNLTDFVFGLRSHRGRFSLGRRFAPLLFRHAFERVENPLRQRSVKVASDSDGGSVKSKLPLRVVQPSFGLGLSPVRPFFPQGIVN